VPVFRDHPPRIRTTISSGGLLVEADALALAGLLGEAPLEILGSTETGGVAWRCQSESPYWNSLPGVAVALSPDGCLSVTSAHLGSDQAFEMGDRIELLPDGRFTLLGRADRVVKVEGKRLSLTEMQQRLEEHPSVSRARLEVVRGRREEVGAVVVLSPPGQKQLHQSGKLSLNRVLRDHLLTCFERPLLPRRWRYVARLPVDSRGKITAHSLLTLLSREDE
jgi:acyl-coenzyme A synthetase/AMP-(fatty) acid ligase